MPGEAEKDMVICVGSARGAYVGQRQSKVLPNELILQVTKGDASTDVIIPYNEIYAVTIQHQDSV